MALTSKSGRSLKGYNCVNSLIVIFQVIYRGVFIESVYVCMFGFWIYIYLATSTVVFPQEASVKNANAVVRSRLDFCNSLFWSISGFNVGKLQSFQNSLTKIIANTTRYIYITPVIHLAFLACSTMVNVQCLIQFVKQTLHRQYLDS